MAEGWTYVLCHQDFRFELKDGEQTVGRSRTSDVAVNDPSVSRKHVILKPHDGMVLLTDLGSSNGTFVNGKKVQGEAILEDGDVLRLGDAELRVEIGNLESLQTVRMPIGGPAGRPQPGEATFFLAAESMKLAEALEAAQPAGPLATQRFTLPPFEPSPAPAASPALQTQRMELPPELAAPPAAMATQRFEMTPEQLQGSLGTQRIELGTQRIDLAMQAPPAPLAPPAPVALGAQTVRLTAEDLRQLESSAATPSFEPAGPSFESAGPSFELAGPSFESAGPSFEPAGPSFEPIGGYPSFEAPPTFEPWAPEVPETSFADIAETPPAARAPRSAAPAAPPAPAFAAPPAPAPPAPAPPAFSFDTPPAAPAYGAPAPAAPAFPAFSFDDEPAAPAFGTTPPPASFVPPPALAPPPPTPPPPAPPAFAAAPAFAPPSAGFGAPAPAAPPDGFPPPLSFDRPTPPVGPPPAAPPPVDPLRGLRQPSNPGEILPSLDDLDSAIGAPGIQDPLATPPRAGTGGYAVGVPWGEPCAGFGIRLLAYVLDLLWIGGVQTAAAIFSGSDPFYIGGASLLTTLVIFFGWSIWGTTPGKRVVGLYLHGEDGQTGIGFLRAFIRMVGYFLSALPLGFGFLMILFTKDHRGLHDRIARTWVYRHSS